MTDNSEQTLASNTLHPESQGTLKGIFNVWQKQLFYELQTCMPAIFLGYKDDKRETGMGIVKPLVNMVDADGVTFERGEMELPIRQFQHGTFMIDAPLVEGDTGWIIAGDRDNTNVLLNNGAIQAADSGIGKKGKQGVPLGNDGPQDPGFLDSHKYLYGFFLPDKWGGIPLPPEMKDSLVIGQVNPNATSHGRFVLDPDGTIHVLSTKWYDAKEQKLRGGAVFVDLSWKGKSPTEIKESWRLGEHQVTAIETILGDLIVKEWEDPDGYAHGGNLKVEHDAEVKGGFVAWLKSAFRSALDVFGDAFFHSKVTVKHDTSRTVTIDPKRDLAQSDAQFREVYIVTGKDVNRSNNGKVALKLERRRILSDEKIDEQPVEFEVGGGGGGGDLVVLPFFMRRQQEGSAQYVCYLPYGCLMYNGKMVSFTGIEESSDAGWYVLDCAKGSFTGSVWCWIRELSDGDGYEASFVTSETAAENSAGMLAYFPVADIVGGAGTGVWEGVTQMAGGDMVLSPNHDPVPFDLKWDSRDGDTEQGEAETVATVEMLNPDFYWNGEQKTAVSPQQGGQLKWDKDALKNQTLYLNIWREQDGDGNLGDWKFEVDDAAKADNGGFSYKLYTFDADGNIAVDFRHSFLEVNGKVRVDAISVDEHNRVNQNNEVEFTIKGWHDQYDINGDGTLPAGEESKPKAEYDPENEGGDVSLSTIIWQGKGPGYSEYQILARKKPGGPLVYIPIVSGADSSDSGDSGSEDYEYYIDITQRDIPETPAHTNGGVEITFQPMKDGQAYGQPTVVTIWHGNDGAPGQPGEDGKDAGIEVTTTPITTTPGGTRVTLTPYVGGQVDPAHPSQTFDIMNGRDGQDGVGIASVVSGTPYQDGDYTVTPVTVTLTNGQMQNLTVRAKNGHDGNDGKDAGVVIATTPITGNPSGTRVTLTPTQGGVPDPAGAQTFDVMNGRDGGGGGVNFTYVAAVRYNMTTHKLEQLFVNVDAAGNKTITRNPDPIVAQAVAADWTEITEAIAHSQTII